MIRSTFAGFNTAVLGLSASQRAIDVTGQNLSNINTQGYTRQRLDQISLNPVGPSLANSQFATKVGQGVMMTGVSQVRDPFLDIQYRNQLPKVGTANAMDTVLAQIGQIFDETDNDAIAVQFEKIVSALQNLGDPQNSGTDSADTVVRSAFEVLLNTVHQNGNKVKELYNELKTKLDETVVPEINTYLRDIAEKNTAIKNTQVLGNPGLELMDSRNEMIDALATYFPIEVSYEKQNLGGGIIVDILNIDLKLADGSKVRLVADDKYGEVGISRWQEDGTGHKAGDIVEPVDMYFKTAEENPKTRGGGLETLKQELPKEINSYIEDIVELNDAIKNMRENITKLTGDITTTANEVADSKATKINNLLTTINTLNGTLGTAEADLVKLNQDIKDSDDKIKAKRDEIKAAADKDKDRLRTELLSLQEANKKLKTDLAVKTNERNIAVGQRKQALSDLKNYFPAGKGTSSVSTDGKNFMTVNLEVPDNTNPPTNKTIELVYKDTSGNSAKGAVTAKKPVTTDPEAAVTWSVSGNSKTGEISASDKINNSVDNAVAAMKKQIETFEKLIPVYKDKRDAKVEELKDYFPSDATFNYSGADSESDMLPIKVVFKNGKEITLISNDNKASEVSFAQENPLTLSVKESENTPAINFKFTNTEIIDRITGSVNDEISEGVLKGDLDMLNKSEVFDTLGGGEATDTKGIQYYGKMLDAFVNKLATEMNELNAIREEVLVFEDDGTTPVYEKDKDGKIVQEPVLDKNGNPVMELAFEADGKTPIMEKVEVIVKEPMYIEKKETLADGTVMTYYEKDLDENGNQKYQEVKKEIEQQQMRPKMQNKQKTKIVVKEQQPLFETTDGSTTFTATNIKISDEWMNNEIKINTMRNNAGEGNSSDNWNVQKMISVVSDGKFDFLVDPTDANSAKAFTGTLYECYTNIQRVQSIDRQAVSQILDTHTQVLDQIADNKDSVSGVWMDEEVMSLMKYSQSYNAASRLMTVMDEVLDRLINQTGVCGR